MRREDNYIRGGLLSSPSTQSLHGDQTLVIQPGSYQVSAWMVFFLGKIVMRYGGRRAELSITADQWCTSSWAFNSHRQSLYQPGSWGEPWGNPGLHMNWMARIGIGGRRKKGDGEVRGMSCFLFWYVIEAQFQCFFIFSLRQCFLELQCIELRRKFRYFTQAFGAREKFNLLRFKATRFMCMWLTEAYFEMSREVNIQVPSAIEKSWCCCCLGNTLHRENVLFPRENWRLSMSHFSVFCSMLAMKTVFSILDIM